MTRVLGVIVHNWPLKLAAIGLATLLYGGFVLSQSAQTFGPTAIPVTPVNQPAGTYSLNPLDPVVQIRYFAPPGVPAPITSSFIAEADLSGVIPDQGPQAVPVVVSASDDRIQIISHEPESVTVNLETIQEKEVTVVIERGTVPEGLELGPGTASPSVVTVSGPSSAVERVVAARADVIIQATGIDVDQDVTLVPVDALGNVVSPVNLEPPSARISIPVVTDNLSRSVTVTPVITGAPPPGFAVSTVAVTPLVVTIEGDADALADLVRIDTEPIPVTGATAGFTRSVPLVFPDGIIPVDAETVNVTIDVVPVTATRSFEVGLRLVDARSDREYATSTDRVLVTIGGSVADLDAVDGATLVADLDVGGIDTGTADVPVTLQLGAGLTLVSASPAAVSVTATVPAVASPAVVPGPSGSPGASPGG